MNNVFVYCEMEGKHVADVSLELLTKGRKLANQLGCQLEAIAAGTGLAGIEKQVLPYGVDKLHVFDAPGLFPYTSLPHTSILVNLFKEEKPQICLMGATVIGRDLGPRVSSALTSGLTADCTQLEIGTHEDKKNGITKSCRDLIVQAYSEYRDGTWTGAGSNGLEVSVEARLMETVEFGFNRVAVESPVVDEDGEPVLNKRGKMQADKAKEDTEDIPLTQDIDAYIEREVRPYNKYAWVDKKKTKVGYTVPFTRVFYKYAELEPADEIAKRILEHEKTLEKSLKALFGEVR